MRYRSELPVGRESDPEFLGRVDDWVANAAVAQPSADEFLSLLPGVWPVEALAALRRLERGGKVPRGFRSAIENSLRQPRRRHQHVTSLAAPPRFLEHPLDFEWLFTRTGQNVILGELRHACRSDCGTVLCLGCPTLFDRGKHLLPEQQFVLWDKNASSLGQMHEAHALLDIDLRHEPLPTRPAIAAVLDPPWYNDFYRLFIWAALRNVALGGHILLSFPPEGTRPSASRDREHVIGWATDAGAELIFHRRCCLPYRSPLFEANALAAGGLPSVPLDWRRGDLLVFRKAASLQVARPLIPELAAHWTEHRFGCVRLRIRTGDEEPPSQTMRAVGKSAVLPSVSTRFPKRNFANVVTTGNRFLHTTSANQMSEICREFSFCFDSRSGVARGSPASGRYEAPLQLTRLIAREQREAVVYFAHVDEL